jgi:hypothetical protein
MLPAFDEHHGPVAEQADHTHIRRRVGDIQYACNKQYCEVS